MIKRKIIILGSTGSIGISTLKIIEKKQSNFVVELLTANNNYKELIKQAKKFKARNVLIKNKKFHLKVEKSLKNTKTRIYSGDVSIKSIVSGKVDYTMSAIVGIAGLQPTADAIKISKTVAISNKESIICAWSIIKEELKKNKTQFIPVDSEHFSI